MSSLFPSRQWLLILMVVFNLPLHAEQGKQSENGKETDERRYVLSGSLDLTGGVTNRLSSVGPAGGNQSLFPFYGTYPSVTFASNGRSVLSGSYVYGLNRTHSQANVSQNSHSASIGYSRPLT